MGDGGWGWKGEGSEAQTNDGKCRKARKGPVINRLSHTHRGRPTLGQGPTEAEAYWMVYGGFWLHEEGETERRYGSSLGPVSSEGRWHGGIQLLLRSFLGEGGSWQP